MGETVLRLAGAISCKGELGGKATWLDRGILDVGDGFDRERHREAMCDIFVEELEGLRLIGRGRLVVSSG